jgi:hypothetical protein
MGLDQLTENAIEGRKQILQALSDIKRSFEAQSELSTPYLRLFFDAKSDELINIFAEAPQNDRTDAYKLLSEIDSFNPNKYIKIKR